MTSISLNSFDIPALDGRRADLIMDGFIVSETRGTIGGGAQLWLDHGPFLPAGRRSTIATPQCRVVLDSGDECIEVMRFDGHACAWQVRFSLDVPEFVVNAAIAEAAR